MPAQQVRRSRLPPRGVGPVAGHRRDVIARARQQDGPGALALPRLDAEFGGGAAGGVEGGQLLVHVGEPAARGVDPTARVLLIESAPGEEADGALQGAQGGGNGRVNYATPPPGVAAPTC